MTIKTLISKAITKASGTSVHRSTLCEKYFQDRNPWEKILSRRGHPEKGLPSAAGYPYLAFQLFFHGNRGCFGSPGSRRIFYTDILWQLSAVI